MVGTGTGVGFWVAAAADVSAGAAVNSTTVPVSSASGASVSTTATGSGEGVGVSFGADVLCTANAIVADGMDAVFTPTDNTIMAAELSIYETFAEAKIPHYTGADSFALNGAFLGYGVDYANLGKETANLILSILADGADIAKVPVMTFDNGTATVNTETAAAIGFDFDKLSEAFAPYCTKIQSITTAESFDDLAK